MVASAPPSPGTTAHRHGEPHAGWGGAEPTRLSRLVARWAPIGVGLAVAAGTLYTGIQDPNTSDAFPLCPLKYATGLDCPACGCLRAVHSLTRGDIVGAAHHNLLFVVALPAILVAYGIWLLRSFGVAVPRLRLPKRTFPVLVGVAIAFAVVRNLPIPGHEFLNSSAL